MIGTALVLAVRRALLGGAAVAALGHAAISRATPPPLWFRVDLFRNGALVAGVISERDAVFARLSD